MQGTPQGGSWLSLAGRIIILLGCFKFWQLSNGLPVSLQLPRNWKIYKVVIYFLQYRAIENTLNISLISTSKQIQDLLSCKNIYLDHSSSSWYVSTKLHTWRLWMQLLFETKQETHFFLLTHDTSNFLNFTLRKLSNSHYPSTAA